MNKKWYVPRRSSIMFKISCEGNLLCHNINKIQQTFLKSEQSLGMPTIEASIQKAMLLVFYFPTFIDMDWTLCRIKEVEEHIHSQTNIQTKPSYVHNSLKANSDELNRCSSKPMHFLCHHWVRYLMIINKIRYIPIVLIEPSTLNCMMTGVIIFLLPSKETE